MYDGLFAQDARNQLSESELNRVKNKNCLQFEQENLRLSVMKKPVTFPSLPNNLTIPQLRAEIRRRLKISEQLGLIRKPKSVLRG